MDLPLYWQYPITSGVALVVQHQKLGHSKSMGSLIMPEQWATSQ